MVVNKPVNRTEAIGVAARGEDPLRLAAYALDRDSPLETERIAGEVLKSDPNHAQALHLFGCALLMQGRATEAIAPLTSAARGRHDPEFDRMLALALQRAGRHEEALHRLKLATKRRPPSAAAFKELGCLLVSLERYDEAIVALHRGLDVAPMMPQLSIQLGYALLCCRNWGDAKLAFARALELSPDSPDALFGIAKAHLELGDKRAAADYFRRHLMISPADQPARLHLGHCLLELGQLDAGYECFRMVASVDSKSYGNALISLAAAARGRFWLRPDDAARFLQRKS